MRIPVRSFLFVPGDSEKKLGKARESAADALVLDLEDSVAAGRKPEARRMVAEYLRSGAVRPGLELWVRINPLRGDHVLEDLSAIVGARPSGLLLPKAEGPQDIRILSHYLDVLEVREGPTDARTEIIAVATETAASTFALGEYRNAGLERLYGMTWGAEDLSADIGASSNKDADGRLSLTYRMARSNMLLGAKAAGVHALETAYPDFRDLEALSSTLTGARREGFSGGFAIHPAQVAPLNEAFSPSAEDIAMAEKVVAAFASAPDVGTIGIDGRMFDRPHLTQAEKVLAIRDAFADRGN
ncbi:HpcH/HpaI aldolase/citrate lyase family protein [Novosphingobium album (ex Liu et al. 2023)]|uniref:CoA ester lyase n=1 Tax=Novosphingobium album (ex Liu et al. 2023) TaxID=3031130 RepID=A0ABT5WQX7_9SPHN|nr:CoA ester lyase [Novosphingobium album (ex Liu et al. 2023)]MDE8652428.1 CoA ester lyase [Novosphingobium album (ex Liu et al. 2023)]